MSILDALTPSADDAPVFKFAEPGDTIRGMIIEPPKMLPMTEYGTDAAKLDRDGKPVLQVLLVLATEKAVGDEHDGRWRVYIDKPLMKRAVFDAVKTANGTDLSVGDDLTIEYTGFRTLQSGRTAKAFRAEYSPVDAVAPF